MTACLRDVLAAKGSAPVAVGPEVTVSQAATLMLQMGVGSVLVMEGTRLVGMLSERDVMRRAVQPALDPRQVRVGEVMTTQMRRASPETTVETAMAIMTRERQRHLPVVDREILRGVVSIGDLVKWVAEDLDRHVADLATYLAGPCARHDASLSAWFRVTRSVPPAPLENA